MAVQILSPPELDRLMAAYAAASEESSTASLDSPILSLLASTDRESLAKLMTEQSYAPGEIIFKEGDAGDAMYIIWSGRVAVVKGDFEAPAILGYRGAGEIIGEMALLEDQPRFASVVALDNLRLLKVSRENFEQFLTSNPAIRMSILEVLSRRLRAADEARTNVSLAEKQLTRKVSELQTEKQQLLELQRLRQETVDLIIHDLRNPLGLISGAINLLEMTLPENILQANQDIIELANTNCAHMKRLVDSLLDVAQMESGEVRLSLAAINLPNLAQKTVDRMVALLQKKRDLAIQTSIPAELPAVVADEEKIDRVLANLIDNAVKHTPDEGEIVITAELKGTQVLISVVDSGPSIPPEDREHIFQRFAQAPRGKAKRGFGLGLAFCRLAVEAHGGRIWVEPGEGGIGNQFIFSLPLAVQTQVSPIAA